MGTALIDELKILLRAETRTAVKAMRDAQKQTDSLEGQLKSLATGAVKSFGTYAAAALSIKKVIDISRESGQAASDAQETMSKYAVVFDDVRQASMATASQLAEDFDLASSTAQKLLGNTGDLLTGFGLSSDAALKLSDTTNRLAIDLASFSNAQGGAAAVSHALVSAFSGEREALKSYGIVINEAMVKEKMAENTAKGLTFATEQQAKIQATLDLATEQSKNAIGDYARTSDSAANVTRALGEETKRLKENYGTLVNEGLTPAKAFFRDLLDSINDNIEKNRELSAALDAIYGRSAIGDSVESLQQLEAGLQDLKEKEAALQELVKSGRGDVAAQAKEALSGIQGQIERTEQLILASSRFLSAQEAIRLEEKRSLEAAAKLAAVREKAAKDNETALSELAKRELEAMEPNEKQLRLLQDEIDKWAAVRDAGVAAGQDMAEVQRLLNDLIDERNRKLSEGKTNWSQPLEGLSEWEQEYKDILNEASLDRQQMERDEEARLAEIRESFGKSQLQARLDEIRLQVDAAKQAGVDEVDVEKWKTEQIIQLYATRAQEAMAIYNQLSGMLSDIYSLQGNLSDAAAEKEIANLDNQIEFKKAAGETYEDLEAEKTEKEDKLARKQFERDKKNRKSETIASGAQAVINAYASMNPIAASAMAAVIAGLTARKVALINQQQYTGLADGGIVPAQGDAGGLYRLGDKNKAETVIPFDIRNLKSGGTTVQVHVDNVYGPGGSEAFAKYIVQTVKRGQSSGRVEKWGA